jgi:hypothetical protein
MRKLPDFKLETWFSKWEFTARYHMTASDAQSMTLAELMVLAAWDKRKGPLSALTKGKTNLSGPYMGNITLRKRPLALCVGQIHSRNLAGFQGAQE